MTDQDFIAWLQDPEAARCMLVEAQVQTGGVETTRYLSNLGYTTGPADTPANTAYLPVINSGVKFSESIDLSGSASISFGDFEVANDDGSRDAWLDDVWVNRRIRVFFGDVRWPRAQFRPILDGVIRDINTTKRESLVLQLTDKLQRLNTSVTDTTLNDGTQNADRLLPVLFGEAFNVEPLSTNTATLEYQVHQGAIEGVIEVRDNGAPVSIKPSLAAGKFTLTQSPVGQITVSAQGDNTGGYANTVAPIIQRLATSYGTPSQRYTAADIDTANFAAFNAAHTQAVGVYLSDKTNVLDCCQGLAASVGASLIVTTAGLLRLVELDLPATGTPWSVTASDMELRSLAITERSTVQAAVKLGFCHNYTVQNQLQTGIPQSSKDLFAQEWVTVTASDDAVASNYSLTTEPDEVDTNLLVKAEAQAEAQRRLGLWKVPRHVYQFTAYAWLMLVELGDAMTITHERFGLAAGKTGLVVSIGRDWLSGRITIGVLI
ncbi:hypothetical protein [Paraburkholderia unamae]|nr:hypothetical protein [Paraburkholderia unamae]